MSLPARYFVHIARDRQSPDHVVVRVKKSWWAGPGNGASERQVAETWTSVSGLGEVEAIRAGLYDAWKILADELC